MNYLYLSALATILATSVQAQQITLSESDQTQLSVTFYSQNLGLIQESRTLGPLSNTDTVVVTDISQQMDPRSLQIQNAGVITAQSFNKSVISYQSLMNSYIGKQIILVKASGAAGDDIRQSVTLLNVSDKTVIVELNNAIESIPLHSDQWRFIFPKKPDNLLLKPSLTFQSEGKTGSSNIQLSYLSSGIEWQMDYVLALNKNSDQLQLKGLASLFNNTGITFRNANIKLLAGSISQPAKNFSQEADSSVRMMVQTDKLSVAPQTTGDLQLYKLPNKTTLYSGQQTQVPLLQADAVKVIASYRYQFHVTPYLDNNLFKSNPSSYLTFTNNSASGLGKPLPAGQARVFSPDQSGGLQFVGASFLPQSAVNEKIELQTGKAFDMSISQKQTSHKKTFNGAVIGIQLNINNSAADNKTLDLSSSFSHAWEIISSTFPTIAKRGAAANWSIKLPANSATIFNLVVRLKTKN
ncbi:MAG: hypothetical protein MJK10_13755 [Pseudomonadales bacterium]|nr:hypothetical protein [Pseudomonadales bacterium]NRA17215.1 hypothetical protein [Oceanospirillaceae bacterium]